MGRYRRVALLGNHTSICRGVHLVDTLLARDVDLVKVFSPEHGFRGTASDAELIENGKDPKSGLPVISLYGSSKELDPALLEDVDVLSLGDRCIRELDQHLRAFACRV